MCVCMKRKTLLIEDACMSGVRALARRTHRQMSHVVNEILAEGLQRRRTTRKTEFRFPAFRMGKPRVNLGDRNAIEALMGP